MRIEDIFSDLPTLETDRTMLRKLRSEDEQDIFHYGSNVGSARVMEKAGMSYEGLLRKAIWVKGRHEDLKLYSIIIDDMK
ncbi:hypothetical protein J14TS5_11110 [Paenibacillus lautus]|uniref:GNAT family N-acetyltransferase n=1 Tax=Paenibacillus lautus TaxID=1401 RepID=UPI001B1BA843|nr:GNAT family protein [Paenibacillus lautus]GIO96025.1 hypothetical protein J14TS5_11110 [Paenibacillus lautus]